MILIVKVVDTIDTLAWNLKNSKKYDTTLTV